MSPLVDLIAVQPYMRTDDYLSEAAFASKIEVLTARIAAHRAAEHGGAEREVPALVVFPEHIGTFLSLAGYADLLAAGDTVDTLLRRAALRRPLHLARTMLAHRTRSPAAAVLLGESPKMHAIYRRVFRDVARRLGATVVAGSAILPENARGLDADTLAPRDNRLFNASYTFAPDGRCVNVTKKVHLVPTLEDALPLRPGHAGELVPIDADCGRVGVMVCYDGFRVPHTHQEPAFRALGGRLAAAGVEIVAQPSANPWPWNERWPFCDPGESQLRREQWLDEGLFSQLAAMPGVRYAVNPQLIGEILGNRFDGRSYIFARADDGTVTIIAAATTDALAPASEEIVMTRVSIAERKGREVVAGEDEAIAR